MDTQGYEKIGILNKKEVYTMSNMIRWDPFREMVSMRNAMDRLFDNALGSMPEDWQPAWSLALDVAEDANEFVVKASVPGINPDDLEITYDANTLTIKGETRAEEEREDTHYHLKERRYGSFVRSISMPSSIKAENIQANYESGVLTLHLPKAEEAKPKRISIQPGKSSKMLEGKVTEIKHKN
jgi:HSP20 family protein